MRKIKSRVKRVVSVALSTMMVLSVSSIRAFSNPSLLLVKLTKNLKQTRILR